MPAVKIDEVQKAISATKADWVAEETAFLDSLRSDDDKSSRLGVIVDKAALERIKAAPKPDIAKAIAEFERRTNQRISIRGTQDAATGALTPAPGGEKVETMSRELLARPYPFPIPPWLLAVDWRNRKGRNNVTPVKDQGDCGSCVAFGTTGALESMVLVEHNVTFDLSEAELLNCGGGSCSGWWPDAAISYLGSKGIAQESNFPYQPHNMPCSPGPERDGEAIQISSHITLSDVTQRKQYMTNIGPMIAVFDVYDDFFSYSAGVYRHVYGGLAGSHCVEVIGYSNLGRYWICKNSWGTGFGESGFFCIAFGECGIDSTYPFWGVSGTKWYNT